MDSLRSKVIRLAHTKPELRPILLPILAKTAAVRMKVQNGMAKDATQVLTLTWDPLNGGVTATAKNDQVNPAVAPEWNKANVAFMYKTMKVLVAAVKKAKAPAGIASGATAILGTWSYQGAWSDDSGLVVTSDDPVFGAFIAEFLPKMFPISGGGVPGSTSYRGSGWQARGPREWVWHRSSFGIGD